MTTPTLTFGPYRNWPSISAFDAVSDEAARWFDDRVATNWAQLSRPVHHLFVRMAYQAKTTSLAARLANSWALSLPAFSLLRIRLEQLIVCSFLIHEDEDSGLRPFVEYIPIAEYKGMKAAKSNKDLASHLAGFSLEALREMAARAQEQMAPGFTLDGDSFQRSWTKLDLCSMAKRRDLLAAAKREKADLLEREYLSIYKVACSVVHADASSLSHRFLDVFRTPGGSPVLMALPDWAVLVAGNMSHYDLLQYREILEWLGLSDEAGYQSLRQKWISTRDQRVT